MGDNSQHSSWKRIIRKYQKNRAEVNKRMLSPSTSVLSFPLQIRSIFNLNKAKTNLLSWERMMRLIWFSLKFKPSRDFTRGSLAVMQHRKLYLHLRATHRLSIWTFFPDLSLVFPTNSHTSQGLITRPQNEINSFSLNGTRLIINTNDSWVTATVNCPAISGFPQTPLLLQKPQQNDSKWDERVSARKSFRQLRTCLSQRLERFAKSITSTFFHNGSLNKCFIARTDTVSVTRYNVSLGRQSGEAKQCVSLCCRT